MRLQTCTVSISFAPSSCLTSRRAEPSGRRLRGGGKPAVAWLQARCQLLVPTARRRTDRCALSLCFARSIAQLSCPPRL